MRILIVEDEPQMARMLQRGLQNENHTVTVAIDGAEALAAHSTGSFDVMVLDLMLPVMDGLTVARRLRQQGNHVPILMLTARDAQDDIVKGLDAGADDYLVKPFALKILLARLRALSRRAFIPSVPVLQVGDLKLDPNAHEVWRGEHLVELTATEFRFVEYLMRQSGRVVSRNSITDAVWGVGQEIGANTVDSYIKAIRDKLDVDLQERLIHTVRGYGYVLRERS